LDVPKISLIASSVRSQLYPAFFKSLEGTTVDYEVVFAGNKPIEFLNYINSQTFPGLKYITTGNIKPAQCYEIARRAARGELIHWTADDALYPNDVLGKAYRFWRSLNNPKAVLSLLTGERYSEKYFLTDLNVHRLNGPSTPLMAPFALISREYLNSLGGFDRRYQCGQYENDVVMRVYQDGGVLAPFTEEAVIVDHFTGHGGVCTEEGNKRPFASGYVNDRTVLMRTWLKKGVWLKEYNFKRSDEGFEPYEDKDLLTKSQGDPGIWE
jgi:hypothetical protein